MEYRLPNALYDEGRLDNRNPPKSPKDWTDKLQEIVTSHIVVRNNVVKSKNDIII